MPFLSFVPVNAENNVTHFKFSYGLSLNECKAAPFTQEISVNSSLNLDLTDSTQTYFICILGRNASGVWQDITSPTVVNVRCYAD